MDDAKPQRCPQCSKKTSGLYLVAKGDLRCLDCVPNAVKARYPLWRKENEGR